MTNADHANFFAFLVLGIWPLVALTLYLTRRVGNATLWTIIGAQMLLPVGVGIKFTGIPAFDKTTIPNIAVLFGCLFFGRRIQKGRDRLGAPELLMAVYVLSPFITAVFNQDFVHFAGRTLPPEDYYDALSAAGTQFISIIPFIIGRAFLRAPRDARDIMSILVIAGLVYSLPLFFEIRMSPQLHNWIYGFAPTGFIQTVREGGGFRPMAFMGHGLTAALFVVTATVAAAALWRTKMRLFNLSFSWVTGYLGALLMLCKSVAAILYAAALIPLVKYASPRLQIRFGAALVFVALCYPLLRTTDLVPTNLIVEAAGTISPQRAESMQFRFVNELGLLERASERLYFGWGRFGRSRIYDAEGGKDMSVTDGRWTIAIGQFGLVGFLAEFGLLALGVFRSVSALRFASNERDQIFLSTLALIVSISVINLLPNAALLSSTWLFAGALLGRTEELKRSGRVQKYGPSRNDASEIQPYLGFRA